MPPPAVDAPAKEGHCLQTLRGSEGTWCAQTRTRKKSARARDTFEFFAESITLLSINRNKQFSLLSLSQPADTKRGKASISGPTKGAAPQRTTNCAQRVAHLAALLVMMLGCLGPRTNSPAWPSRF